MAERRPSSGPRKKLEGSDLLIPAAAIAFTFYYFTTIWNAPWTAQVNAFFIGTILLLLCSIFIGIFAHRWLRGEATLSLAGVVAPLGALPKRLALFGLTIAYIIVISWAGFTITTFAFLALAMLLLSDGRNKLFIGIFSFALSMGGYLLFVVAFKRRFPEGPIELLLKPLWFSLGIWP